MRGFRPGIWRGICPLALVLFVALGAGHALGKDVGNFEAHHEAYMASVPAYKEADAELNAAWKTLRGHCSKQEFQKELAEQRNWLKNRLSILERLGRTGMGPEEAALKMMRDRIALLNNKICAYDPSYVTFSVQVGDAFENGQEILLGTIVPSRPVMMDNHVLHTTNKSRHEWVNEFMRDYFRNFLEDRRVSYNGSLVFSPDLYREFWHNDVFQYDGDEPIIDHFVLDYRYTVVTDSDRLVCVMGFGSSNLGMVHASSGSTATFWFDPATGRRIAFSDLFGRPEVASRLAAGMYVEKLRAMGLVADRESADEIRQEVEEYFAGYSYLKGGKLHYRPMSRDFSDYEISTHVAIQDLLGVHVGELRAAMPNARYFDGF